MTVSQPECILTHEIWDDQLGIAIERSQNAAI